MAALADAADAAVECHNVVRALKPIDRNIHFLGLLSAVIREMDSIKRDNNMLLLSDTGGILSKIIGDDETPFSMSEWVYGSKTSLSTSFRTHRSCSGATSSRSSPRVSPPTAIRS